MVVEATHDLAGIALSALVRRITAYLTKIRRYRSKNSLKSRKNHLELTRSVANLLVRHAYYLSASTKRLHCLQPVDNVSLIGISGSIALSGAN